MAGSRFLQAVAASVAAGTVAALLAISPASADPPNVFIAGEDTGVPADCAEPGTGAVGEVAHYRKVPYSYVPSDEGANTLACAQAILTYAKRQARGDFGVNAVRVQQLQAVLFTGWPSLAKPYQVFLNNLYLTAPLLESLTKTADTETHGLGSCQVTTKHLLIRCRDDEGGAIVMRNKDGSAIVDQNNQPVTFPVYGAMTQRGGTVYGGVYLEDENNAPPFNALVEHHEQVHAQQWTKMGWDFGPTYAGEHVGDGFEQWWTQVTTGQYLPIYCFNIYERDAHWLDGGYTGCPAQLP